METVKDDLLHIQRIMERSSTFLSLSGLSGISAGITALIASSISWYMIQKEGINYFDGERNIYSKELMISLLLIALGTFIIALASGLYFTNQKAKRLNLALWNNTSKAMLLQLSIPLLTGGCFCLIMIKYKMFFLVAPATLLFYGLSLVSASKYTHKDLFNLGILEIGLSFAAFLLPGYGLVFWAIGFGVLHILYGIIMHYKYP